MSLVLVFVKLAHVQRLASSAEKYILLMIFSFECFFFSTEISLRLKVGEKPMMHPTRNLNLLRFVILGIH
ncbi:hypothetical protein D3C73_1298380 [compost metagenome]